MDSPRTVVILTALREFVSAYSVCHVVEQQVLGFRSLGHPVILVVDMAFAATSLPERLTADAGVRLVTVLDTRMPSSVRLALERIPDDALVISHDLLFLDCYELYAEQLHLFTPPQGMDIYHLSHSTAGIPNRVGSARWRCSVPRGHNLLALSQTERHNLARYYEHPQQLIRCLPNYVPPLLSEQAQQMAESAGLLTADIAALAAISMPRAWAKRIDAQVRLIAACGPEARLLIVNAHSTSEEGREQTATLRTLINDLGVKDRVLLASDLGTHPYAGLPNEVVRELLSVCNLFMLTSMGEACPLALLEAAHAGCLLVVERELIGVRELVGDAEALQAPFKNADDLTYRALAMGIKNHLYSPLNKGKRRILREHTRIGYLNGLQELIVS